MLAPRGRDEGGKDTVEGYPDGEDNAMDKQAARGDAAIEVIAAKLTEYFDDQADVSVAYMFGSVARGDAGSRSDVDVGVLFGDSLDSEQRLWRRIELAQELETLLSRPVDVVDLKETPPPFNHHVLRHNFVLKGMRDPVRIAFEKEVRRLYFDMLPYRQRYLQYALRRLKEGEPDDGRGGVDSETLAAARRVHQRLGKREIDEL